MTHKVWFTLFMLIGIAFSASCNPKQISPTPEANMPNPASVHCEQNGGQVELRQDATGGVIGVCVFPDGSECDEWAYFRGECKPKDLLLTPPVPGIAFPRQKPTEGLRECMLAQLVGTLRLEGACLNVQTLGGGVVLPVWPPEFTLRIEGDQVLVSDGEGQVAARAGEEVYMGGGYVGVTDEWVLQQIPPACRGDYFIVGCEVRPNLRHDSELFALDVVSTTTRTALFLRCKPVLDEQVVEAMSISGKLVAYDYRRCLHLQTDWGPGSVTLLWPADWSVRVDDETIVVLDGTGQAVTRMNDEVRLRGRAVPHDMDVAVYRQLIDELPGDCIGTSWLVDGVE